jgi:hypothetical protein
MKSKVLQAVVVVFVVMTLMPVLGRAQAEINPDHFDSPAGVATAAPSFYGSFNLPFSVRCAGVNLPPGPYSLSVQRLGKRDVITLASLSKTRPVRLQAIGTGRTSAWGDDAPSALVVERTEQRRRVSAIRFAEPAVTFDLQGEKKAEPSGATELVPISTSTRRVRPD